MGTRFLFCIFVKTVKYMAKKKTETKTEMLLEEEVPKQESELDKALKGIEKDFGKGTVIGGNDILSYTDVISTGSIGLDSALGIRGLPLGKIVEILGWESSGKSTITLQTIANAQKKGLKCLLVDGENSFDRKYAIALGVNPNDLLYVQLDGEGGERAYEVASRLIQSGGVQVCIIDSINALQPKKVILEGLSASTMGLHSRMMGQVCPQFNYITNKYNCLCIFISQIREKIGVMFGSPETTQGGNAMKFYAHVRIDVRKSVLKDGDKEAYANQTRVKVIKNKMAAPFKTAQFNINFGTGIDVTDEIISLGSSTGLIKKWGKQITLLESGEKYDIKDFHSLLKDNEEFYNSLRTKIVDKLNNIPPPEEEEANDETES